MWDSILGGLSTAGSAIGSGLGGAYDSILGMFGGAGGAQAAGNFINPSTLQSVTPSMSLLGDMANAGGGYLDSILGTLGSQGFANTAKAIGSGYQINEANKAGKHARSLADQSAAMKTDAYDRSVAEDEARKQLTF